MDKAFEKRKKVVYDFICDSLYVPMKFKELAMILQVPKEQRDELREVLESLEADGKIYLSKRGKFCKGEAKRLAGTFRASLKGFGFVVTEDGFGDVYICEEDVNGAFDGDQVEFVITKEHQGEKRNREGRIVGIIARGMTHVVGLYRKKEQQNYGFVLPDNQRFPYDIFVPAEKAKGAVSGHKVVVELTSYGDESHKPEGRVVEILGHVNDPGVDILAVIRDYDLPTEFGEKVMNQAGRVPAAVSEADRAGRLDLRDLQMVTIDGEDAKDLDDAVSLYRDGEGLFCLGVHIADVSNYVQENSALDWEALERGTSVYLVDRVIPMLPHRLSNGICSLNEGVDRLALSCLMTIDQKGEVKDYRIAETVIRVDRRMSYTTVRKILEDKDEAARKEYGTFVSMFEQMEELAALLRTKRHKRGSIDFDFAESKIFLDGKGRPVEIKPYERNVATRMIEDFMLIANETVAQHFFWQEMPFVYRTHEKPDPDKIRKLSVFIRNFGYHIRQKGEEIHPKELQKLLDRIGDTKEEAMISRLTLRSMKQAKYTVECTGHFGLACRYYCHFTSPIRRYPDLQIHRIIKEQLRGKLDGDRIQHYVEKLPEVAKHASRMERRAAEAERETDRRKKAQYMEERAGEVYEGVISGITQWGLYVELPNTVEGLIHVSTLPGDYFYYDESAYEMVGKESGIVYRLGQKITVQVKGADRMAGTIDFMIPEQTDTKQT